MTLKSLRLFHAQIILDTLKQFMEFLADIFFMHRYLFENLFKWFSAALKFIMCVHYFSCGWVLIHEFKRRRGWDYV